MDTAIFFRVWRFIRIPLGIILIFFIGLVIYRMPVVIEKQKTEEAVLRIHAQKITLDDVMGKNLPPDPGADADKTVQGIDVNQNGIRDDVELAIFKEYPDSAKTRAVLLQYALALQMEVRQLTLNEDIVNVILEEDSRAGDCIADTLVPRKSLESSRNYSDIEKIDAYIKFVDERQFNTNERKTAKKKFYEHMGSYSNSPKASCDIDTLLLSN